jgi:hypothetical protein
MGSQNKTKQWVIFFFCFLDATLNGHGWHTYIINIHNNNVCVCVCPTYPCRGSRGERDTGVWITWPPLALSKSVAPFFHYYFVCVLTIT